jgi:hypothetical protein
MTPRIGLCWLRASSMAPLPISEAPSPCSTSRQSERQREFRAGQQLPARLLGFIRTQRETELFAVSSPCSFRGTGRQSVPSPRWPDFARPTSGRAHHAYRRLTEGSSGPPAGSTRTRKRVTGLPTSLATHSVRRVLRRPDRSHSSGQAMPPIRHRISDELRPFVAREVVVR